MTETQPMLVQTVEYVVVDGDPVSHWVETYDDSGLTFPRLGDEWGALPNRYLSVLSGLVEADPSEPARCWRCGSAVGYVEAIREDTYGREIDYTEWHMVVLVAEPGDGPVSVQCELCCPDIPIEPGGAS